MDEIAAGLLWDARRAAALVLQFVQGKSLADYEDDVLLRSAVERQLQIMGEALFQLRRRTPSVAAQIADLEAIVSFRHVLVHGYRILESAKVWSVTKADLPSLFGLLNTLLETADNVSLNAPPPDTPP